MNQCIMVRSRKKGGSCEWYYRGYTMGATSLGRSGDVSWG